MAKILIIEDDQIYAQNTCDWLEMQQHVVEVVNTGSDGLERLAVFGYDLLIVDYQLPDCTGPEIIKSYRAKGGRTPILMLTVRQLIGDKEAGFDAGADDYLDKAVHPKELSLRVSALLRRPADYREPVHRFGAVTLDNNLGVLMRDGEQIHLMPKEYALISFLMNHPEKVFTAEELLDKVWPSDSEVTPHTVRTCVNRIRVKLDVPDGPSFISTVRGLGYGLNRDFAAFSDEKKS